MQTWPSRMILLCDRMLRMCMRFMKKTTQLHINAKKYKEYFYSLICWIFKFTPTFNHVKIFNLFQVNRIWRKKKNYATFNLGTMQHALCANFSRNSDVITNRWLSVQWCPSVPPHNQPSTRFFSFSTTNSITSTCQPIESLQNFRIICSITSAAAPHDAFSQFNNSKHAVLCNYLYD